MLQCKKKKNGYTIFYDCSSNNLALQRGYVSQVSTHDDIKITLRTSMIKCKETNLLPREDEEEEREKMSSKDTGWSGLLNAISKQDVWP